jgi:hypothetical protein
LLLMLIVAWSTADGFEHSRLKVIVVSSLFTSFFSSVSTFDPVDCYVPSSSHRLDDQSNRGRKRLIVAFTAPNLPSHLVEEAHHLQWSLHALVLMPRLFCQPVDHIDHSAASTEAKRHVFRERLTLK